MWDWLCSYGLSPWSWGIALVCALCIGMSKTGISGISILVIPLMAALFGGRPSTGIILPMLIMADMFAVTYYHRHAEWKYIIRLLPWALAGIALGMYVGKPLSDQLFKQFIAITVLVSLGITVWNDYLKKDQSIPDQWWVAALFGMAGGSSTMIGNAAGPIMAVYLLSMRLPKNNYVGTSAWFFAVINLTKLPLQIWGWHNISLHSIGFDLLMLPAIILGAFLGIFFVKKVSEKFYRVFILLTTAAGSLYLFF